MTPKIFLPILLAVAVVTGSPVAAQQSPDNHDAALAFAQCVRDNGYAEFPDPDADGGFKFLIEKGGQERFRKATEACRDLAPEGMRDEDVSPEQIDALIKLSQCVRENGVPDFPDPDAKGGYDLSALGLAPGDARLETAMKACGELRQGAGRVMIGG